MVLGRCGLAAVVCQPDDNGEVHLSPRVGSQPPEPPRTLSGQPWDAAGPCPPLLKFMVFVVRCGWSLQDPPNRHSGENHWEYTHEEKHGMPRPKQLGRW